MYSAKYSGFDISELAYKVVNNQDIKAFVLVPKVAIAGKHPILAKFHGGGFINGASLYPDWHPQWALDYALLHSAIIVTADYRLLPESNGLDILEDITDFWNWVRNDLQSFLDINRPGIEADLSKIIVHGESAGGTLSMLSDFTQPRGFIKAVIAMYPGINFEPVRTKAPLGLPPIPKEVLAAHLKSMVPGKIVTSATPPERLEILFSIVQQNKHTDFFGRDDSITLPKLLEKADDMAYTLILHGENDSLVPVQGSLDWAEKVKAKFGDATKEKFDIHIELGENAEHGFDCKVPFQTSWLQQKLVKVTELWLGKKE